MILINKKEIRFSMRGVEDLNDIVPEGNWLIKFDEFKLEYFLEKLEDFKMPVKVYGDCKQLATRYLNTFVNGTSNLGIVLSGLKGTGKSLTAKQTCIDSKLPVLIMSEPFSGTEFNSFISSIKQEAVVFIDEFEKLYPEKPDQDAILSLLDGVFMGKKLFIFTSNETSRYSNYLLNRPGRIHYMKEYERIDNSTLDDIVLDNLINQEHSQELKDIINIIEEANIDMVVALIKECNMYNENPKEAVKYLNIKLGGNCIYTVLLKEKDSNKEYYCEGLTKNPMIEDKFSFYVEFTDSYLSTLTKEKKNDPDFDTSKYINILPGKYLITQKDRIVSLENDKEIITFSPMDRIKFVF